MKKTIFAIAAFILIAACSKSDDMKLKEIVNNIENEIRPLSKEAATAYWNGTITGESGYFEIYSQNSMKITSIYSDPATFATLKSIKERDNIEDPILKRELEILYNNF